jgi:hypothetical protein
MFLIETRASVCKLPVLTKMDLLARCFNVSEEILDELLAHPQEFDDFTDNDNVKINRRPPIDMDDMSEELFRSSFRMTKGW